MAQVTGDGKRSDGDSTDSGASTDDDGARKAGSPGDDVDWAFAGKVAGRLAPAGPKMTAYTREQVYEDLLTSSAAAEIPVREVTGLADGLPVPAARVVDRAGWAAAATDSMRHLTTGDGGAGDGTGDGPGDGDDGKGWSPGGTSLSGKAGGAQAGAMFAFLSTAILGQYDPFTDDGTLLLVAPNVVAVERALRVRPKDFRMWVCLHEVTHRVQFSSSPWLAGYMRDAVDLLGEGIDEPIGDIAARLTGELRRRRGGETAPEDKGVIGLVTAVQAPPQREAVQRMLMLGTLLEGHADHVMDAVGPDVVPTVARIRKAFDHRRQHNPSLIQRVMRALLGVDAKMAQYVRGKAFVDAVVEKVGMEQFNAIWTGPETLPLSAEIEDPALWIARVLG